MGLSGKKKKKSTFINIRKKEYKEQQLIRYIESFFIIIINIPVDVRQKGYKKIKKNEINKKRVLKKGRRWNEDDNAQSQCCVKVRRTVSKATCK